MARSHGVIKTEVWDAGSDYRHLTVPAQWAYEMLISQPQITNCGVQPYLPARWVKLADGLTRSALDWSLLELRQRLYIVLDEDTSELLVRTFIKHDRIWKQPNLVTSARRELHAIESDLLRELLGAQYPWLLDDTPAKSVKDLPPDQLWKPLPEPLREPLRKGLPEPLPFEGLLKGVPEPLREGVNARATRATPPLPPREGTSSPDSQPATPQQAASPATRARTHDEDGMRDDRSPITGPGLKQIYSRQRAEQYVRTVVWMVPPPDRERELHSHFGDTLPSEAVPDLLDLAAQLERSELPS